MEFQKTIHQHPLIFRDDDGGDYTCSSCWLPVRRDSSYGCYSYKCRNLDISKSCRVCKIPVMNGEPSYGCNECKDLYIHKSCGELAPEIQHPFHPRHPLFLGKRSTSVPCRACGHVSHDFNYHCAECEFVMDTRCASKAPTLSYSGHHHLLTLFEKTFHQKGRSRLCACCNTSCHFFFYRCVECDFNVHKSCASNLSKHILHPFHPLHHLHLTQSTPPPETSVYRPYSSNTSQPFLVIGHLPKPQYISCNACFIKLPSMCYYKCKDCKFNLCEKCALLVPNIKYEGHRHLLTFFPMIYFEIMDEIFLFGQTIKYQPCHSCNMAIRSRCLFRCVECSLNFHPHCLSIFPSTLKLECHVDPLTLTKYVNEGDSNEFYCDVCEKQRNRYEHVYYCAECQFVAEIKCVIDEILPSLIVENTPKILEILEMPRDDESNIETTKKSEVEIIKDHTTLVELENEIARIDSEMKSLAARRKLLKHKLAQYSK